MPKIPEYEKNVSLRPAFRQGVDVHATPEAFGAGIGRGMQGLALGVENAGAAMAEVQGPEDVTRMRRRYAWRATTLSMAAPREFGRGLTP